MKIKMMEHNGSMALVVSGERQNIIITEEGGWFALELINKEFNPVPPVLVSEEAQVESQADTTLLPMSEAETVPYNGLFKKLALLRKSLAVADNVPPYLVFHDKTLHEMVAKMPLDMQAMGRISGVGQAKLEKYGPVFLDAINGVTG